MFDKHGCTFSIVVTPEMFCKMLQKVVEYEVYGTYIKYSIWEHFTTEQEQ